MRAKLANNQVQEPLKLASHGSHCLPRSQELGKVALVSQQVTHNV